MSIIGRTQEQKTFATILRSKSPAFVALHGRRRVGKTYLIREYFHNKGIFFEAVGMKDANMALQLQHFSDALSTTFANGQPLRIPPSWHEAFAMLTDYLTQQAVKNIVFLDELPWLATKRSGFLASLDYYWNAHWSKIPNLILIVCGSAASWMLENIVHAKGGLYNRLTHTFHLQPFCLAETKAYLHSRKVRLTDKQIVDLYMVLGGIPHYLKQVHAGWSATQTIDELCFTPSGLLHDEFPVIFQSLFDHAKEHEQIVRTIAKQQQGVSRETLLTLLGTHSGGTFKKRMDALIASGFVKSQVPYGKKQQQYYRVIDEYTMFYLRWIEPFKKRSDVSMVKNYWQKKSLLPEWRSSAGYLFENVCYKHVPQIQKALGLDAISCDIGTWRFVPRKGSKQQGAQIDLLFDRADGAITLCEIKYSDKPYKIDKPYGQNLMQKMDSFAQHTKTHKQLFLALITTQGLQTNLWSEELVAHHTTLNDLFVNE